MVRTDIIGMSSSKEPQSISVDKLHRRNPQTVRQEIQSFDDVIPEIILGDIQLNEMPGLQNAEQWKRIATRTVPMSPPLSLEYHSKLVSTLESPQIEKPEVLQPKYQPSSIETKENISTVGTKLFSTTRRRILFGLAIVVVAVAIIISVVIAVVVVRRPNDRVTDYYSGFIIADAGFDPILYSVSSTLSKNYQREFCLLISTTFIETKTKYAIFYATCELNNFRNGSIIGDFVLGFTRFQNITRLNSFLNRTLINKDLFGGTVLSIVFNTTTDMDNSADPDYESDYDVTDPPNISSPSTHVFNASNLTLSKRSIINNSNERKLHITYTANEKGSSVNILVTTNTNISSNRTNQNYNCIFIPILENAKYSFVFTNDNTFVNSSSHFTHVQLANDNLTATNHQKFDTNNASSTNKSTLNNTLPITNDQQQQTQHDDSSTNRLVLSKQDSYLHQPSYNDNSSISLTTVSSCSSSLDSLKEIHSSSWSKFHKEKLSNVNQLPSNESKAVSKTKTKYFSTSDDYFNTNHSQPPIDKHASLQEKLLQRTHSKQQTTISSNPCSRKSIPQSTRISSSSNNRTTKLIDTHPYQTQKMTNRPVLNNQYRNIPRHQQQQQSLNPSNFQTIPNKKRVIILNQSSTVEKKNQTVHNKNRTIKSKILNLLKFIR